MRLFGLANRDFLPIALLAIVATIIGVGALIGLVVFPLPPLSMAALLP
jgi:hypothetical protein